MSLMYANELDAPARLSERPGHMAIQFAALTGADVVAIGRSEGHLRVALELGAARAINSSDLLLLISLRTAPTRSSASLHRMRLPSKRFGRSRGVARS
jgi:hypothetical protein